MEDFNWKDVFFLFYLYWILDIVASYHCMQFQGKLTNQTWENGKKPSFWPDFGPFDPNFGCQIFFFFFFFFFSEIWLGQSLDIMFSYHHVQYQKKLTLQSWENFVMDVQTYESDFIGCCRLTLSIQQIVLYLKLQY